MDCIRYINRQSGEKLQETVPGEGWLKWLYHNPLGKLGLEAVVKRKFLSSLYGKSMDKPQSKNKIVDFVQSLSINMDEAVRPVEDYKSFNDFFIRKLKDGARPVDMAEDTVVSPADGKVLAFENMTGFDNFFVKGTKLSLTSFLADDNLAKKYEGGTLLIIRLAPVDYHRFHFPASGKAGPSRLINGSYYSVSPYAVKNNAAIYWQNKREYSLLHTQSCGDILLCEVGATMVGSIIQSYSADTNVKKGDEKGWFKFGGSTVIMLLEKDTARIDSDIIENTKNGLETSIKMGEKIATVNT